MLGRPINGSKYARNGANNDSSSSRLSTASNSAGGLTSAGLLALAGLTVVTAPLAHAENNGVGLTPLLGWSSWSFIRKNPTAVKLEAQADAMKNSGLAALGYTNINLDDFWYQCPGSQGPNVDHNGRWVTDTTRFPDAGTTDGIQVLANYVHAD